MSMMTGSICLMCLTTLGIMLLLKKLRQPYLIAYIITGILLGPYITGVFKNTEDIHAIGEIGILLFMFFIGMEINVPDSRSMLIQPVVAQSIKIVISIIFSFVIGYLISIPLESILLIAILFVFNSTPVVSDFLSMNGLLKTPLGLTVLNMLIFQDILFAPILTALNIWKGGGVNTYSFLTAVLAVAVCLAVFLVLKRVRRKRNLFIPRFLRSLESDYDLQVFTGLLICLGFASVAETAGLSGALGSFIAGIYIGRAKAFKWLEHSLLPFKVFFVSLFFVSVGLQLDIDYLLHNYRFILLGTLFIFISNSLISAGVFRLMKFNGRQSLLGGALLSHTGEFGLLALSVAHNTGIIDLSLFKAALGITSLSLLLSTIWVSLLQVFGLKITGIAAERKDVSIKM